MVWLIFGLVALAFAVVCFVVYRRGGSAPTYSPRRRVLSWVVAALAALIAGIAAALTASDRSIEYATMGTVVLSADAVAALAVALLVASGRLKEALLAAPVVAALWLGVGLGTAPFVLAVSACACVGAGPDYVAPAILGLDARTWIVQANVLGPILLVVIGLLLQASGRSPAPAD